MFTLLWTGKNTDGWDIFHSIDELKKKVKDLIEKGFSPEDMMIFNSRDYIVPNLDGKILFH